MQVCAHSAGRTASFARCCCSDCNLVFVQIGLYSISFGFSWGPVGWLIPSEIHDLNTRSAGQSITVFTQLVSGATVTQSKCMQQSVLLPELVTCLSDALSICCLLCFSIAKQQAKVQDASLTHLHAALCQVHVFWQRLAGLELNSTVLQCHDLLSHATFNKGNMHFCCSLCG